MCTLFKRARAIASPIEMQAKKNSSLNEQKEVIMSSTKYFTKKDEINSRNSMALQDLDSGTILTVQKAALLQRKDLETSETKDVAILVTDDGEVYSAISAIVCDLMDDLIELIDESAEEVQVRLNKRKSKAGREFLSLTIL